MCLCELAHICREEGRVADAEVYFIKARAIRQESAGEQSEEVAACSASIGACLCFFLTLSENGFQIFLLTSNVF